MPRPLILVCIVVFAIAMLGVKFAANGVVNHFGVAGGLVVLAAMFGAAWVFDQRERP